MKIAMSGASGYVGTHLAAYLTAHNHRVIPLGRKYFTEEGKQSLQDVLSSCHAVINLAGASIQKRWTESYKKELYQSRIHTTGCLIEAMHACHTPPELFISASAVGYYSTNGTHDESGQKGTGFLSDLCDAWEAESRRCPSQTRRVITRFGVVLSADGGALAEMIRLQKLFRTGIVIGNGRQAFPWIGLNDLCRGFLEIIEHPDREGIFNFVAPQIICQRQLAEWLTRKMGLALTLSVPTFLFRIRFGEGASFLTEGARVIPKRLPEYGFTFESPDLDHLPF